MFKILLAEDDANLGDLLLDYLEVKGYQVSWYQNGTEALSAFLAQTFDLCILDVMMPELDGFSLAQKIRLKNSEIPILFLTARALEEDKLKGFEVGGDDYMTKPFSMEELLARINAKLRRTTQLSEKDHLYSIGKYTFDVTAHELTFQNEESYKLTSKENELLLLLIQNINAITDRKLALETIWGEQNLQASRTMDVYVTKLRRYLAKDEQLEIINVHKKGFKLIDKSIH
jgi:two-component system OmpR family response regulator